MKPALIAVSVALSTALLSWSVPTAYGRGGHGGGAGGGGHYAGGGGGHSGFAGAHAPGVGRGYGGGVGGYHTGGAVRTWGGVGSSYTSAGIPRNPHSYGSYSTFRNGTRGGQYVGRTPSGINRTHQFAASNQARYSNWNPALHSGRNWAGAGTVTTRDGRSHPGSWSRHHPANRNQFGWQTQERLRNWQGRTSNFAEAQHHHGEYGHHHGRNWWHNRCDTVILVGGGYWGWYDGWWYPAWGYDPYYSYYDYDGPIYGYDGLTPDEAVANVQSELQRLGYYSGSVDGVLGPLTRDALRRYQRDQGISVTGAIDQPTATSLGLDQ